MDEPERNDATARPRKKRLRRPLPHIPEAELRLIRAELGRETLAEHAAAWGAKVENSGLTAAELLRELAGLLQGGR